MSELETLIAVAGTLGGSLGGLFLGYVLDQRRETNRLRRETALKPLEEKQAAMRDAFNKLIDLIFTINRESKGEAGLANIRDASDRFSAAVSRIIIWMPGSLDDLNRIYDAETKIRETCLKIVRGEAVTRAEVTDFGNLATVVIRILGKQLGVDVLDTQLQEFAMSAVQRSSS